MVPTGTLVHELGHLFIAKFLGYETVLHHSSLSWNNKMVDSLKETYKKYEFQIKNDLEFEGSYKYHINYNKYTKHRIYIISGGILQTILWGTIAYCLLLYRLKIRNKKFDITNWILSFISLFWLREVFVLLSGITIGLIKNKGFFYGDEVKLASLLNLNKGIIIIPLGFLSLIISLSILKLIPKSKKNNFLIGGILGCSLGIILWVFILGPKILP